MINDVLVLPLELLFTRSSVNSTLTNSYVLLAQEASPPRTPPTTQGDERNTEVQGWEWSGANDRCFGICGNQESVAIAFVQAAELQHHLDCTLSLLQEKNYPPFARLTHLRRRIRTRMHPLRDDRTSVPA